MKIQAAVLAFTAALLMGHSHSANLRSTGEEIFPNKQRNLFLQATTINSVVNFFVPVLNGAIQAFFSVLELGNLSGAGNIGEIDFGVCTAFAPVSYDLGSLTGLDTFEIETLELVPGTELWESSFLGLSGASWNGTWVFKATFDEIRSTTQASIGAQACEFGVDESIGGSIVAENTTMDVRIQIAGSSPNLFSLGYSFAESIDIQEASINYDSISLNVGGFGQNIDFDVGAFLENLFVANLNERVLPSLTEALRNDLANGLAFK